MDIHTGTSDGALSSLVGDWVLSRDAATGRFVRRFTFALPTAGLADGVRWQPSTLLVLSFPSFDYDARAAGAPESVTAANRGDGVQLTFPTARTLHQVKVVGAQSSDSIEAYRVDEDLVTDDPFASAAHQSAGAVLDAVDRQLLLRQKRGATPVNLPATNIQQVIVRSAAANVRVGVNLPALGGEIFFLPPASGSVLTQPATAADLGAGLAAVLESVFDRYAGSLEGETLPTTIPLVLCLESDTPTRAHITGFSLSYRLSRRRFADRAPKRVFEFDAGSRQVVPLQLDVPRGAALWSATLRMMGPFAGPSDAAAGEAEGAEGSQTSAAGSEAAPAASDIGVPLRVGETAGTRALLERAVLARGVILDVIALAESSGGRVQLHRDADGQPGEVLATAALPAVPVARRRDVRVDFDDAQTPLLSAGPIWVTLQCDTGGLLWMTQQPSTQQPSSTARAVSRRARGDLTWVPVPAAAERGASAALVTASAPDAAHTSHDDATAFHGVRLYQGEKRLRGAPPPPGAPGQKETHFSIATALAPLLAAGAAGSLVPIALSLISSERCRVTVYPPEFEFDP